MAQLGKYLPLGNRKFDCWMNSLSQAFLRQFDLLKIENEKFEKEVRRLQETIGLSADVQQDAHEGIIKLRALGEGELGNEVRYQNLLTRTCSVCGDVRRVSEVQEEVRIPFNSNRRSIIRDYFETNGRSEEKEVNEAVECVKCNGERTTLHCAVQHFLTFPKILCCVLMRFNNDLRKITTKIDIPDQITLYSAGANPVPTQYYLKSIVNHYGSTPNAGHYTANVCSDDGTWILCNDRSLQRVPWKDLKDQNEAAYVLFYSTEPPPQVPTTIDEIVKGPTSSTQNFGPILEVKKVLHHVGVLSTDMKKIVSGCKGIAKHLLDIVNVIEQTGETSYQPPPGQDPGSSSSSRDWEDDDSDEEQQPPRKKQHESNSDGLARKQTYAAVAAKPPQRPERRTSKSRSSTEQPIEMPWKDPIRLKNGTVMIEAPIHRKQGKKRHGVESQEPFDPADIEKSRIVERQQREVTRAKEAPCVAIYDSELHAAKALQKLATGKASKLLHQNKTKKLPTQRKPTKTDKFMTQQCMFEDTLTQHTRTVSGFTLANLIHPEGAERAFGPGGKEFLLRGCKELVELCNKSRVIWSNIFHALLEMAANPDLERPDGFQKFVLPEGLSDGEILRFCRTTLALTVHKSFLQQASLNALERFTGITSEAWESDLISAAPPKETTKGEGETISTNCVMSKDFQFTTAVEVGSDGALQSYFNAYVAHFQKYQTVTLIRHLRQFLGMIPVPKDAEDTIIVAFCYELGWIPRTGPTGEDSSPLGSKKKRNPLNVDENGDEMDDDDQVPDLWEEGIGEKSHEIKELPELFKLLEATSKRVSVDVREQCITFAIRLATYMHPATTRNAPPKLQDVLFLRILMEKIKSVLAAKTTNDVPPTDSTVIDFNGASLHATRQHRNRSVKLSTVTKSWDLAKFSNEKKWKKGAQTKRNPLKRKKRLRKQYFTNCGRDVQPNEEELAAFRDLFEVFQGSNSLRKPGKVIFKRLCPLARSNPCGFPILACDLRKLVQPRNEIPGLSRGSPKNKPADFGTSVGSRIGSWKEGSQAETITLERLFFSGTRITDYCSKHDPGHDERLKNSTVTYRPTHLSNKKEKKVENRIESLRPVPDGIWTNGYRGSVRFQCVSFVKKMVKKENVRENQLNDPGTQGNTPRNRASNGDYDYASKWDLRKGNILPLGLQHPVYGQGLGFMSNSYPYSCYRRGWKPDPDQILVSVDCNHENHLVLQRMKASQFYSTSSGDFEFTIPPLDARGADYGRNFLIYKHQDIREFCWTNAFMNISQKMVSKDVLRLLSDFAWARSRIGKKSEISLSELCLTNIYAQLQHMKRLVDQEYHKLELTGFRRKQSGYRRIANNIAKWAYGLVTKDEIDNLLLVKLTRERSIIFLLGDSAPQQTMKYTDPGGMSHQQILRNLSENHLCVSVSEFRSSKVCPKCWDSSTLYNDFEAKVKHRKVLRNATHLQNPVSNNLLLLRNASSDNHNVQHLVYKSTWKVLRCPQCGTYWNRDVAATVNLGIIFMHTIMYGIKPEAFYANSPSFVYGSANKSRKFKKTVFEKGVHTRNSIDAVFDNG